MVFHCDSQLVANQLTGEYATKNERMRAYMRLAQKFFKEFKLTYIKQFLKSDNSRADALPTLAYAVDSSLKTTI